MKRAKPVKALFVTSVVVLAVLAGAVSAQVKPLSPGPFAFIGPPVGGIVADVTQIDDEVFPGENATYNVSVTSITTETEYVNFTIEPERSGWTYTFDPEGFDLDSGETNYSILSIGAPSDAALGDYYHNVTANAYYLGMLWQTSPYYNVTTTVTQGVPTYATVLISPPKPPKVQYKWEKPDSGDPDHVIPGTQVSPISGKNVTVDKYVVVCDPNGKEDIEKVIARTFYPLEDGSSCNCTACNETYCCEPDVPDACNESRLKNVSIAEPLPNLTACEDAKWDAYKEGLLTEEEVEEIDEYLANGTGWIYVEHNEFNCSDPAGNYTVCAQVFDNTGLYDCMANTFEYLSVVSLTIDFTNVTYGNITPNVTKWVTPGNVKNDGNDPMDVVIESWNMTNVTTGGVIPADALDANVSGIAHWLAPTPGVLFDVDIPGCTPTPINFSIHAPIDTPQGDYSGYIRLTGQHG